MHSSRVRLSVLSGLLLLLSSLPRTVFAAIPLPLNPDWESTPNGQYGTGLGVGDLNNDGWMDLVVANGNDMARQRLSVYLNRGDGTYATAPTWSSADIDYNGHLDLADVDGDGHLDCAVAVYIGQGGFGQPGRAKLYRGNGDGTFSSNPTWSSAQSFYCFSLSFGDMDMDGRPDLACATGDDYEDHREYRKIFRNLNGTLESTPSWSSTEYEYSLDATWADFNNDGALDLAFAGTSCPNRIYYSVAGAIQTTAGWSSTDNSIFANTVAAGDVDGDGWVDLAIADNNQLGGSGRFKLYKNLSGSISTTPTWNSNQSGYGSHVSFIDADEDGDLDLSTGQWWGPVRIYENVAGALGANPSYTSSTSSVIENQIWEDVDNDGLQRALSQDFVGDGSRRLFSMVRRPVRSIVSVHVGGVPVDLQDVALDCDDAWILLPTAPAPGAPIHVVFASSADVDLALSNWDTTEGEYLFRNTRNPSTAPELADAPQLRVWPNPSAGPVNVYVPEAQLPRVRTASVLWEVVDVCGRRVAEGRGTGGTVVWSGQDRTGERVPSGVYWFRLLCGPGEAHGVKLIRR